MAKHNDVTLFIQCLVDSMYPQVGMAMVKLFNRLNISMDCPTNQTCCGQVAYNSGYVDEAKIAAKKFIQIFENANTIVCPSGSCVDMVRHHYPLLFKDNPSWLKRAQALSKKIFELCEYIVDVLQVEDLNTRFNGKITYHDSCHLLRNLGVSQQPRKLIKNIKGATLVEMENSDKCCGFGGLFSVKYPDISTAILSEKIDHIISSDAKVVAGCDISCLMNIQGMLSRRNSPVKTMHMAQLLAG